MTSTKVQELMAMMMIGDGVVAIAFPERHVLRWTFGPAGYRRAMWALARRPGLTRFLGAAEAGLGLWWAARLKPSDAQLARPDTILPEQ